MSSNDRPVTDAPAPGGPPASRSAASAAPGTSSSEMTPARLTALRGNCMGTAVLLIVQFGLGIGVNLYVTLPRHKSFLSTVFGSPALAVHAIVALLLLGSAIAALVRAIRARTVIVPAAVGLAAILAAAGTGASFTGSQASGASLAMALATAVALLSYLVAVFRLR